MLADSTYSYVTCPKCGHKINDITPNVFYSHLGEIRKEFYDLRFEFRQALAKKDDEISELRKENVELRKEMTELRDSVVKFCK